MYYRTSRLAVIKFLGLFGTNITADDQKFADKNIHPKCDTNIRITKEHYFQESYDDAISLSSKRARGLILEKGIPGMIICVSKCGKIVWQKAFGFCDVENQVECQTYARMRIASISKAMFASTVVAPMIEEKKVDIKRSIYDYLTPEEFPRKTFDGKECDITIEQLLSHTSGVRHYSDGEKDLTQTLRPIGSKGSLKVYQDLDQFMRLGFYQRETFRDVIEALNFFKDDPLIGKPGDFSYTTNGYTLLSAVIQKIHQLNGSDERAKNEQIEDYWMRVLRQNWGLHDTCLDQDEPILFNRARYYLRRGPSGSLINAPYTDNSVKWAGGGVVSTTQDLVRLGNLLIDSYKGRATGKLKKETVELLWKEVKRSYALGFEVKNMDNDNFAAFHLGFALGASSALVMYPESEVVVAILTNLGEVNLTQLSLFIADQFASN